MIRYVSRGVIAASPRWRRAAQAIARRSEAGNTGVMTALKSLLIAAVVGYSALAALIYLAQRSLLFGPDRTRTSPAAAGVPQAQEVTLQTADGEQVIVWHVPPHDEKPVIVYFHGNGGALAWRNERFGRLIANGAGLVALSYRGYGGSSGSPTELGLKQDAAAAYAFAASLYGAERIVLWGESLGTNLAIAIAAEHPVARVVLESPHPSVAAVAASIYWFIPARWLIKDPFRSDLIVGKITKPILVLHGEQDRIIPIRFAEQLYEMITAPKQFVRLPGAGHNDHDAFGAQDLVRPFIQGGR
jgi:pimeloyl-ACP methyl ester carboxylesterase